MTNIMEYLPQLISGIYTTLFLTVASLLCGLLFAMCLTAAHYSNQFILKQAVNLYVFLIRGTPLLVQIFIIYYGAGQFEWIRNSPLWILLRDPTACAIMALSMNTAAYTTVLLLGAINSVPKNEVMACEAMGMSKWLAYRRIILPRAWRIAISAYSNEVIMVLKSTSLASTITLLDIMGVVQRIISATYDTVSLYFLAAAIYLALNTIIAFTFKHLKNWSEKSQVRY